MLDLEQVANLVEVVGPARVWPVSAKKCLGVSPATSCHRFDVGDGFAATRDRVALTVMLDCVEEVGELAGRFGSGDLRHGIRLSDSWPIRKGIPVPNPPISPLLPAARRRTWHRVGARLGARDCASLDPAYWRSVEGDHLVCG